MRKFVLAVLLLSTVAYAAMAQVVDKKVVDNGSSGPYKAVAASEATLPYYVLYRPQNIKAAFKSEGRLPIIVFGNGGCANTSITH
jgi:hypothetical protein